TLSGNSIQLATYLNFGQFSSVSNDVVQLPITFTQDGTINVNSFATGADLAGAINLGAHNLYIFVDDFSSLQIHGAISGTGGTVQIVGHFGTTVSMLGTTSNAYTGLTKVIGGTLQLGRTGATSIAGPLTIGDFFTATTVQFLADNQVSSTAPVEVTAQGIFDLNGHNQTMDTQLTLDNLGNQGATVSTGTGILTLTDRVTVNPSTGTSTITGKLNLSGSGDRTFQVGTGTG